MFFNTDTGLKEVILHWSDKNLRVASYTKYVTQLLKDYHALLCGAQAAWIAYYCLELWGHALPRKNLSSKIKSEGIIQEFKL